MYCTVQSCVNPFLLSFENRSQNVPLPTPNLHNGAIIHPAIPETWHEGFTLLCMYVPRGEEKKRNFLFLKFLFVVDVVSSVDFLLRRAARQSPNVKNDALMPT